MKVLRYFICSAFIFLIFLHVHSLARYYHADDPDAGAGAAITVAEEVPAKEVPAAGGTADVNGDPAPADPDPAPAETNETPADPSPAPANPDPTPAEASEAPADPSPAPVDPDPTLADPAPAEANEAPADPSPAPADPDPTSADPAPAEANEAPTQPNQTPTKANVTPGMPVQSSAKTNDTPADPGPASVRASAPPVESYPASTEANRSAAKSPDAGNATIIADGSVKANRRTAVNIAAPQNGASEMSLFASADDDPKPSGSNENDPKTSGSYDNDPKASGNNDPNSPGSNGNDPSAYGSNDPKASGNNDPKISGSNGSNDSGSNDPKISGSNGSNDSDASSDDSSDDSSGNSFSMTLTNHVYGYADTDGGDDGNGVNSGDVGNDSGEDKTTAVFNLKVLKDALLDVLQSWLDTGWSESGRFLSRSVSLKNHASETISGIPSSAQVTISVNEKGDAPTVLGEGAAQQHFTRSWITNDGYRDNTAHFSVNSGKNLTGNVEYTLMRIAKSPQEVKPLHIINDSEDASLRLSVDIEGPEQCLFYASGCQCECRNLLDRRL